MTYPNCPQNCTAAHNIKVAMFLLGVGRTKLYDLMARNEIAYVEFEYGRRILHDEIRRFLGQSANTGEHLRTDSVA